MKIYTFIIGSAEDFESLEDLIDYVEVNKVSECHTHCSAFEFETEVKREEDITMIGRGYAFSEGWCLDDTFSFLVHGELAPNKAPNKAPDKAPDNAYDLAGRKFLVAEDEFIQAGIDAREQLRVEKMMSGTATPTIDPFDPYNPNDPRNW